MKKLILLLLLLAQGQDGAKGFRFEGRILREGFPKDSVPPPLTIQLTELGPQGRAGTPKTFTNDVGADGFFEFRGLPEGVYQLNLFPGMQTTAMSIPFVHIDADTSDFWLTVALTSMTAPVKATVTLEGGGVLPPVQLSLSNANPSVLSAERKAGLVGDTITLLEVPVADYDVRITDLPAGYSVKALRDGEVNLQTERLRIHPARPPQIEVTLTRIR